MAAAEAWKGQFLERVVEADVCCRRILETLAALAEEASREASDDLDFVMTAAGEVTVLALRGGALDPSEPLTSVRSLRVHNLGHRHAVKKLLVAMEGAEAAYVIVKLFNVHLLVMRLLLDRPGLCDDVDDLIKEECHGAIVILRGHAMGLAEGCAELAGGARADVDGGN